ncbi:MAG: methyltransferase domain-containing protein [Ignavibacteriales bacterium]|nr:methyltransferase domain-containing protein [Ignavibacteriales bacterium]
MKREFTKEIMDDFSIRDERIDFALAELNLINKFLGGNSTTGFGVKLLSNNNHSNHKLSILDVGAGSSEVLQNKINHDADVYSLDLNFRVCEYLKEKSIDSNVLYGNALHFPFKEKSIDIVHLSLFLHHFTEPEINSILTMSIKICKAGIVINDLRRSWFAYFGISLLTKLFSKSEMVKNDGPLSVKRGFTKNELLNILSRSGITNYKIYRTWAFRWLVVIYV